MRVLVVHNYYRSCIPSGENIVVESEIAMLRAHGHVVSVFSRTNDSIRKFPVLGPLLSFVTMVANPVAALQFRSIVRRFRPDVIHMHNLFPLISPLALLAVGKTPVVMTLHNYRLFCAEATICRGGSPCTLCIDRQSVFPALRNRCYRHSLLATIPLAASIALYRQLGFWKRRIARFVVLTEFQRQLVLKCGLPADRVVVKVNHVRDPGMPVVPWLERRNRAVYVGRVSREKGCETLIRAWNRLGDDAPELVVIGDGEGLERCRSICTNPRVRFRGRLNREDAVRCMGQSKLTIMPSLCFEGLPTAIVESFMCGTPVLASDIGALPDIVRSGESGEVFLTGDEKSLAEKLIRLWKGDTLEKLGGAARRKYEEKYSEAMNHDRQIKVYQEAVRERAK